MLISFGDLAEFTRWAGGRTAVKGVVTDLGDAAFTGPKADSEPNLLAFRKGTRGVRIVTVMTGPDGKRVVSMRQLRAVADLIESRLKSWENR